MNLPRYRIIGAEHAASSMVPAPWHHCRKSENPACRGARQTVVAEFHVSSSRPLGATEACDSTGSVNWQPRNWLLRLPFPWDGSPGGAAACPMKERKRENHLGRSPEFSEWGV